MLKEYHGNYCSRVNDNFKKAICAMPKGREFTVTTPLGSDTLLFSRMRGYDEVGGCFTFDVDMVSEDIDIAATDLLGQGITLRIGHEEAEPVFLHGLVDRLSMTEVSGKLAGYRAQLRPWLWFLSKSADNRIFQNLSIVEIIEEVFSAYPVAKFENRLQRNYDPIPYCVQYGESDLHFLMRWMEHEGIFTFFEFDDGDTVVFDFDAFMSEADGVSLDAFDGACEIDESIDGVDGLVHQRAASIESPSATPTCGVVVGLVAVPFDISGGRGEDSEAAFV